MSGYRVFDFDPRNLPQELLAAIGLAITSSAQNEQFLQEAIAACAGMDAERGYAITTHMTMPLRFSALRSAAEIHIDDLDILDKLDEHLDRLDLAINKRNTIAHRQWARDPKTGELFTIKQSARARLETDLIPMTVDQVKSDALFIYQTGIEFFQFLSLNGLLPAVPSAVRPREHKSKAARKNDETNCDISGVTSEWITPASIANLSRSAFVILFVCFVKYILPE